MKSQKKLGLLKTRAQTEIKSVLAGQVSRKVGYAHVSTDEQNLDLQHHTLEAAGCGLIFEDKGFSGTALTRPGLRKARCGPVTR